MKHVVCHLCTEIKDIEFPQLQDEMQNDGPFFKWLQTRIVRHVFIHDLFLMLFCRCAKANSFSVESYRLFYKYYNSIDQKTITVFVFFTKNILKIPFHLYDHTM